jgi:hypothetical protein
MLAAFKNYYACNDCNALKEQSYFLFTNCVVILPFCLIISHIYNLLHFLPKELEDGFRFTRSIEEALHKPVELVQSLYTDVSDFKPS